MSEEEVDPRRRRLLAITTGMGLVGTVFAAVPFALSMNPSARAKAAGAPVEEDISKLALGEMRVVEWRGKPVWIVRRTPEMLASLPDVQSQLVDPDSELDSQQPPYAQNLTRSIKPEVLVLVGLCTHLGCSPRAKLEAGAAGGLGDEWPGGFFCPCHGSKFDLAGRVYKNVAAPTNMIVPPHSYIDDSHILIGINPDNPKGAA